LGVIQLDGNEQVRVEAGSMVSMSQGVTLKTKATGGLIKAWFRSKFAGESFFQNVFQAPAGGGQVTVAPPLPGDVFALDLHDESLTVQSGSYVASEMGVELNAKWGGAKTFFASEGLIMLKPSGTGKLLLSSYGAIHEVNLERGQSYTVDTGHLVAFSERMKFRVRSVGGIKSTLFSGEGLVVDLTGPGRVFMQTRSTDDFISWLLPHLPKPEESESS
jgi:uncharacterized protein (TIGR00266 family)